MIIKNQNSIKKRYKSPLLEVVKLDNHIALENPSTHVPGDPDEVSKFGGEDTGYKKPFPDAPASDNPFGGSSPKYK